MKINEEKRTLFKNSGMEQFKCKNSSMQCIFNGFTMESVCAFAFFLSLFFSFILFTRHFSGDSMQRKQHRVKCILCSTQTVLKLIIFSFLSMPVSTICKKKRSEQENVIMSYIRCERVQKIKMTSCCAHIRHKNLHKYERQPHKYVLCMYNF